MAWEEWCHWLEGVSQPFVVWTDHKNLEYLKSVKRLNARQARWALFFGCFNFILTFRPGSKKIKPDALSWMMGKEDNAVTSPEPIIRESCIVEAVTPRIEEEVKAAQTFQPDPGLLAICLSLTL